MSMINIRITVPTDPEYWGAATDHEAMAAAELHLSRLVDWARDQWPSATITGGLVPEVLSIGNQTTGPPEIVDQIMQRGEATFADDAAES